MTTGEEVYRPIAPQPVGPSRPRGRPRRVVFVCMKIAAIVALVAVVAAGGLFVRMNAAPISVNSLGQTIAHALQDRFGKGLRFTLGDTSLVQRGIGTNLSVSGLSVTWPDGTPILTAPKAELAVSTVALLFGKIVPKRLEVFDVTLRAMFLKDGNMAIAAGDGSRPFFEIGRTADDHPANEAVEAAADTPPTTPIAKLDPSVPRERAVLMRQAATLLRQFVDVLTDSGSPIAAVDRLGISHGTLIIQDQETNEETVYRDLDLTFDKQRGVTSFGVSAEGPSRRWTISALAKGEPGSARHFDLQVRDVTIDELRLAAGTRSRGFDMDAPLGMHFDVGLNADNSLSEASGGFELGAGFLRTDDPDFEPLFINSIGAEFRWNASNRRVMLDKVHYVEGDTHFLGRGEVTTPAHEGEPWQVSMKLAEPGLFAPDRKGQEPIAIEDGVFEGRLLLDRKTFLIDRFAMRPKDGGAALAGTFDWVDGPHIKLGLSMDPTSVQFVGRAWPSAMASEVRAWILNHFEAGVISDGIMRIDYNETDLKRMRADHAPADSSVSIDFKVTKGRLRYLNGVPPLDDVVGSAHITGRTTKIAVTSATSTIDGRKVMLTNGSFSIADSSVHPVLATVSTHLTGNVEAITSVLALDALKKYASMPIDPTTLHGQIEGDLKKGLVLGDDRATDPSHEALTVSANVTNFQADRLIGKENLENASMTFSVNNGMFSATGQGRAFGGPTTFQITHKGNEPPHAEVGITLDDAARSKLGLSAIPGVSGSISAHVSTNLGGDPAQTKAIIDLDLAKTSIAAAYLGLNKPAGRAAKITLTYAPSADRTMIDPIAIDVGSLQARGSIELAGDNSFQAAHFPSFKVSTGDEMKLDVSKADDVLKMTIRAASLDARPFLKALTSIPANEATPLSRNARAEKKEAESFKGYDIDMKSSLLTGFNKEVISGAELKLSKRDASIRQFAMQGRFGHNVVSGSMAANGRIKIAAQDAGALVSFIDLYKHMEGGNLSSTMQMGDDTLNGSLEIQNFILRDEPAIRRLVATSVTMTAPGQDTEAARRIDGGAVGFNRLKVNFERDGSHLELRDATMSGPDIGLSVDGWLDYSHDRVGMKGTFVPAFAVNNLFSQIPVFGVFLGGKSNEGLLAITFNISGQASQPSLSINPLSVIAPGILRNIFGILDQPAPAFSNSRGEQQPLSR